LRLLSEGLDYEPPGRVQHRDQAGARPGRGSPRRRPFEVRRTNTFGAGRSPTVTEG
jgi:hypothetical protein